MADSFSFKHAADFDKWEESVHKILNSLGGWPSMDTHWSEEKFEFLNSVAKARRLYGHSPFFNLFVSSHPKNRTRNVIYVSKLIYGIVSELHYNLMMTSIPL